jgi:hypothetical protein
MAGSLRALAAAKPPMRPITDRAEVSIDFPEKAYIGSFGRTSGYDAEAQADGVAIKLVHGAPPKRAFELHLHWYLFADIVDAIADSLEARPGVVDEAHRAALADAAARFARAAAAAAPAQPTSP